MPLYTFGGTPAAVLTDQTGLVIPDYPLTVRVAGTGQEVGALYEEDGVTPIGQLRSNPSGSAAPGAIRAFKCDAQAIEYEHQAAGGLVVRWYEVGREVPTSALDAALQVTEYTDGLVETVEGKVDASDGVAQGLRVPDALALGDVGDVVELFEAGGVVRAGLRGGMALPLRVLPADTARFDLAGPATTLFRKKSTAQPVAMQSLAVDSRAGEVYISQLIAGGVQLADEVAPLDYATRTARGDICITKMSLDGTQLGHMYIRGAGHGTSVAIEYDRADGSVWLWCDRDSSSSGFARSLSRIRFQAGAIIDSDDTTRYAPATGMHGVGCCIDPVARRLAVLQTWPDPDTGDGWRRCTLYDLDDAAQNLWVPLAQINFQVNRPSPGIGTFQGKATFGRYFYTLDGLPGEPAYITAHDWVSGQQIQRTLITAEPDLTYREPEGMAIWIPDPSAPERARLVWGWADGDAGARDSTLCYLQASPVDRLVARQPADGSPVIDITAVSGGGYMAQWRSSSGTIQTWISVAGRLATIATTYLAGPGVQIGAVNAAFGGGSGGMIGITDATAEPTSGPAGGGVLWAKDGALKWRASGGQEIDLTQAGVPVPSDHGLIAWSMDPVLPNASTAPASGVMQVIRMRLRSPRTVSSILLYAGTAGSGLTSGACFAGIYSTAGQLLGQSADQSAAWASTGSQTAALTAPLALPAGTYLVAFLANGTTPPAFSRASAHGGNVGLTASQYRWARYGSGLTALPASITPGSLTEATVGYFVGLR